MTAKTITLQREAPMVEIGLYVTAFSIPFLVAQPQLAIGSVVNAMLFMAAARLTSKHLIPLAVLPSVAALARGLVFGPSTPFLTFFLPFIWMGNLALVLIFRKAVVLPELPRLIAASVLKAGLLLGVAAAYVQFRVVPGVFVEAMGLVQLETALLGGLAALGLLKLIKA